MRIIRRIDRGGFGYVEEVETNDGQRIARKTFDPQLVNGGDVSTLQRRFEREVRIQSAIRHPNIMPVLRFEMDHTPPWFTMPLAIEPLQDKLQRDHQNNEFDASIWPDILGAVEELHRLGYVHRDLKPANILNVGGTWVISDFGLILPTMRDTTVLTGTHSAYGSHFYAAPEQASDFRHTPEQADIFALGCILHDALEPIPQRIPFTQIRIAGDYGPIIEKCTEFDPRRRFPNVSSLRAALFDLWRTSTFSPSPNSDADILQQVLDHPDDPNPWRRLLAHLETSEIEVRHALLQAINENLITNLYQTDEVLFSRLIGLMCSWAMNTGFAFEYCDIVGDRLLAAYKLATVRIQLQIVLATLELAVSHNRWHVMRQAGGMLSTTADDGLVDRLLIESQLDDNIPHQLRTIEHIIDWSRKLWHEKIKIFLDNRTYAGSIETDG